MEGQQLKEASFQNEMNLIEFLRTVWEQKIVIVLITSFCVFLGIAYIVLLNPVYEAATLISPPTQGDIAALNQGRSSARNTQLMPYKIKEIYEIFIKNLQAESTKRVFFNTVFLPSWKDKNGVTNSYGKLYIRFVNSLIIKEIRPIPSVFDPPPSTYIVAIRGVSPEQNAEWVTKYIDLAQQKALAELMTDVNQQRESVIRNLRDQIDSIRDVAKTQRLDRIQQLKEAIKVAQAVRVKEGKLSGIIADASVVNNPSMMYLQGSAALQAELNNIENRGSSDAFAPKELKLREKQSQLDFYKKLMVNPSNILMFKQDDEVIKSDFPIAPHKKFILLLVLLVGLVAGISWALIRKSLTLIFQR